MTVAINDLVRYIKLEDVSKVTDRKQFDSLSIRLELWKSTPYFVKDYPLLGVGNGNFQKSIKKYVDQGYLNPIAAEYDHAHNVFVNATVNKGLLGLTTTCLVFFLPLFVYLKSYRESKYSAIIGILYTAVMFIISLNESAPFYKSNFVATFLILSMVIFQNHLHMLKKVKA